jgi:hypothetical protein
MAKRNLREEAKLLRDINKETNDLLNAEKKLDSTYEKRQDLLSDLESSMGDINELKKVEKNLNEEINRLNRMGHTSLADKFNKEKLITGQAIRQQKLTDLGNASFGLADELLSGMLGTMKGFINPFTATAAIAIAFSGTLDEIGGRFGAIGIQSLDVRNNLMDAQVEATKLGKSMSDVLDATTQLTDNFGVGLSEAIKLSSSVVDTSVALGITVTEAGDLIGSFQALAGLSADQATSLAKNVTLLAKSNDVAPQAVLRDIASSSEAVAGFTDSTGTNIARAAIQARRLGISLSDVASSAKSLLDFQSTYQKSLEASVLVGRQINVERMMELSLAGDLEGLQQEQIKQLGTQSEFNKLNILQREALAEAVGLSLDQATKLVNKEKEAVTLAGQLAGQPGFDELVGEKGISSLTRLTGSLKSLGATLTNSLGPILNVVLKLLVGVGKVLEFVLAPFNAIFRGINTGMEGIATPTALQTGGIVTGPTNALVGEAGPEAVVPLDDFNRRLDSLKSEMSGVKDAIMSLQLTTKITNKDLNVILTPSKA